jgi:hypothetical protein
MVTARMLAIRRPGRNSHLQLKGQPGVVAKSAHKKRRRIGYLNDGQRAPDHGPEGKKKRKK